MSGSREAEWYRAACMDVAPHVSDVNILMGLNALLFRVNERLGRTQEAIAHFHLYYNHVKEVANNLPDADYVSGFMNGRETVRALEIFSRMKHNGEGQPAKQAGPDCPVSVSSSDVVD